MLKDEQRGGAINSRHPLSYTGLWAFLVGLAVLQTLDSLTHGNLRTLIGNRFAATADGEWWRLFTAQFIHLNWTHLAVDAACIGIVWRAIWAFYTPTRVFICFVIAGTAGQAFGLLAWLGGLTHYGSLAGSSDALHGLFYLYLRTFYVRAATIRAKLVFLAATVLLMTSVLYTCATGKMIVSDTMLSPGYNHLGGILVFMLAVSIGFLRPPGRSANA